MDMNLINRIPGALQGVVEAGDLSGFVTLIWRKGEIVQLNTLGKRDIAADKPMTRDTMFRIASMTKPLTSVLALMLMEEGRLKLDDPITKWAPEFSGMKVLKSATGPLDDVVDAPRDITVEDLLTHRSGLAYGFTSVGPIAHAYQDVLGPPLGNPHGPDMWLERLAGLPLTYAPGERFHYSHATDVLGFLVGRVAGTTYQDFLKSRILEPLGMTDTDFWCPPEKRDRMAKLYKAEEGVPLKDVSFVHEDHPPAFCAGGGGLISTVDDYLTFARLMLNRGELNGVRLIREDTFDLMASNRLTPEQREIPFMGIPFWMGQGFGLGHHRPGEAGLDGRRLDRRLRLAGRLRYLVAGGPRGGHDPHLPDPELHGAGTGVRQPGGHRPAHGCPGGPAHLPEADLRRRGQGPAPVLSPLSARPGP